MAAIRKMRIHGFGGKEVLRADDVEPSLRNAAVRVASVNPVKTGYPEARAMICLSSSNRIRKRKSSQFV